MPPKLVIFDMDGVLYGLDRPARLALFARLTGLEEAQIQAAIWDSGFEEDGERGVYETGSAYLAAFNQRLGSNLNREDWFAVWRTCLHEIAGMLPLVNRTRKKAECALLTNNGMLLKEGLSEGRIAPKLRDLFGPRLHVSAELKSRKPERAVYHRICHFYDCAPEQAVMIDDSPGNVEGARHAGLQALHYRNATTLADEIDACFDGNH